MDKVLFDVVTSIQQPFEEGTSTIQQGGGYSRVDVVLGWIEPEFTLLVEDKNGGSHYFDVKITELKSQ